MKKFPVFETDEEAGVFVATADLSEYDLSGFRLTKFEFKPKDTAISLRLPDELLKAIRSMAKSEGIPFQRFIRQAIENEIFHQRPRV
jgi:predicted DNA binding CopG/RHH family protein